MLLSQVADASDVLLVVVAAHLGLRNQFIFLIFLIHLRVVGVVLVRIALVDDMLVLKLGLLDQILILL